MPTQNTSKKRSPAEAARELYASYFDMRSDGALQRSMAAWAALPPDMQLYVCAHLAYLAALQGGKVLVRLDQVRATTEESAGTLEAISEALLGGDDEDVPDIGAQEGEEDAGAEEPPPPLKHPFLAALQGGLDVDDGSQDVASGEEDPA